MKKFKLLTSVPGLHFLRFAIFSLLLFTFFSICLLDSATFVVLGVELGLATFSDLELRFLGSFPLRGSFLVNYLGSNIHFKLLELQSSFYDLVDATERILLLGPPVCWNVPC